MSVSHERTGLACHLLCAVPQLLDPNFKRSVVLMLEHDERGALGLVINRTMNTSLSEVAEALDLEWCGDPDAQVRIGGPVEPVRGWFLHDQSAWDPDASSLVDGLWVTTSLEGVGASGSVRFGSEESNFLFLLGYAGWSGGQLEGEIAAGSWVLVPLVDDDDPRVGVDPTFLFDTPPEHMWSLALQSIGVDPQRLVGLQGTQTLH